MKLADAPRAGWYPDPDGGSRLRWWDGTDWTANYRARPTEQELSEQAQPATTGATRPGGLPVSSEQIASVRRDTDAIINEVRQVARGEIERAADLFSARARAAVRDVQPLVSEYTLKFARLFKVAAVIVVIALVGWFAFQVIAQQSFYDWLGDRIDNLTD
jgi:uncharacterized protein DUF2510